MIHPREVVIHKDGRTVVSRADGLAAPLQRIPLDRFIRRLTAAEFVALSDSRLAEVRHLWATIETAPEIDVSDTWITAGIAMLEARGLLAAGRAALLLALRGNDE
jgi:hypothetical protein